MIFKKNVYLLTAGIIFLAVSFSSYKQDPVISGNKVPAPSGMGGKELAELHCSGCHEFTPPGMLDKKTWKNGVLPEMGLRLGMGDLFGKLVGMNQNEVTAVLSLKIYPEKPVMSEEDWKKIVNYFLENAPDTPAPQAEKKPVADSLGGFRIIPKELALRIRSKNTFVMFNPAESAVYAGGLQGYLYKYDLKWNKTDSLGVFGAVSDAYFRQDGLRILDMGRLEPNHEKLGKLFRIEANKTRKILADTLRRPVAADFGDLDQDGTEDMVIANFGFETGKLSWKNGKTSRETVLRNLPGARNVYIADMNQDGMNDIVALMTQAREGVLIFYNRGNGKFEEKEVLSFSPLYGSSYLQIVDFDKDGFPDLLYTNGDNEDYSNSLKNYHGIRLFRNDGKNNFKEAFFYPVYGATKAIAADFDNDGDLDIVMIANYPSYEKVPNEGFLFLENLGSYDFKVSSFPDARNGNWISMDVADMDNDGDLDIVLGSFEKRPDRGIRKKLELVIFENLKN